MQATRLYDYLDRKPQTAVTLRLIALGLAEELVQEWGSADIDGRLTKELAADVMTAARQWLADHESPALRFALKWLDEAGAQKAQTVFKETSDNVPEGMQRVVETPDATGYLSQIMRHAEANARTYHSGIQTVMRLQQETIGWLGTELAEARKRIAKLESENAKHSDPEADARAVAIQDVTTAAIEALKPRIPDLFDRLLPAHSATANGKQATK